MVHYIEIEIFEEGRALLTMAEGKSGGMLAGKPKRKEREGQQARRKHRV